LAFSRPGALLRVACAGAISDADFCKRPERDQSRTKWHFE